MRLLDQDKRSVAIFDCAAVVAHAGGQRTFKELFPSDLSKHAETAADFGTGDAQLLQVLVNGEVIVSRYAGSPPTQPISCC